MSIDAIEYGVQHEDRVTRWFRIRCDDSPSGFIELSKTPPTGANAMTVTIKPLYGEPFTVNADLLRAAVNMALGAPAQKFEEVYERERWRRKQLERLEEGDRVEFFMRGRADWPRVAVVEQLDDFYAQLAVVQHEEEVREGMAVQKVRVPRLDISRVFDREAA